MVLLRRTSVGCAVSTGLTSAAAKKLAKIGGAEAGRRAHADRVSASVPGRGASAGAWTVHAHLPDVVLVFGDVGEVREIAEGAHDAHGLADRHAVEDELRVRAAPACRRPRWNRIEVCRMRSTRSNTSAPSWSRTVSPRMRPSSRISFRSRASSSSAKASAARLDRRSASEGMIWEDMVGGSRNCPASSSRNFLSPAQDQEKGDAALKSFVPPFPNRDRAGGA